MCLQSKFYYVPGSLNDIVQREDSFGWEKAREAHSVEWHKNRSHEQHVIFEVVVCVWWRTNLHCSLGLSFCGGACWFKRAFVMSVLFYSPWWLLNFVRFVAVSVLLVISAFTCYETVMTEARTFHMCSRNDESSTQHNCSLFEMMVVHLALADSVWGL